MFIIYLQMAIILSTWPLSDYCRPPCPSPFPWCCSPPLPHLHPCLASPLLQCYPPLLPLSPLIDCISETAEFFGYPIQILPLHIVGSPSEVIFHISNVLSSLCCHRRPHHLLRNSSADSLETLGDRSPIIYLSNESTISGKSLQTLFMYIHNQRGYNIIVARGYKWFFGIVCLVLL